MDWRSLALKNISRTARRYLGYLFASALAVTVFCMFTVFVDNPAVQNGYLTQTARELMSASRVVVALFAIFFIFYFHSSLMRARSKEIGLFITLGMLPRQIGILIFLESLCIGLAALVLGLVLGMIGAQLFLLAMSSILALPATLPFVIPPSAIWVTIIFFGIVFLLEAGLISLRMVQRSPRMLILGARTQQAPPRSSWWLVGIGLLCLVLAYDLALQFSRLILITMIPIIVLATVATYLLYSQVLILVLNRIRRPGLHGIALLIVSRLAYRIRDYARMMTLVTLLSAAVLAGMGAVFGVLLLAQISTLRLDPFAIQFANNTVHAAAVSPAQIRQEIKAQGLQVQAEIDTPLLVGQIIGSNQPMPVTVMSLSAFRSLEETEMQAHPELRQYLPSISDLAADHAHIAPSPLDDASQQQVQLQVGTAMMTLQVDQSKTQVLNDRSSQSGSQTGGVPDEIMVVSDQVYSHLNTVVSPDSHWHMYSFVLPNWQQSTPVVDKVTQQLGSSGQGLLTSTVKSNEEVGQLLSVMLFAGFFISSLFFLAAGCAMYFKLFAQQEEDRRQFHTLERIGLGKREAGLVLSIELLMLFFIPVGLAIVHSSIALVDLMNLLAKFGALSQQSITSAFGKVCLLYVACFVAYFLVTRVSYLSKVYKTTV